MSKPRIALCGLGYVGSNLAKIAMTKSWDIVAAYNRAGDKIGKDVGEVCGLEKRIGVLVEDAQSANLDSLAADVVLVAAGNHLETNYPIYERFLSAGVNVLCNATEAYYPRFTNPSLAEKIDRLARDNGVTFTGSGMWDMTRFWSGIVAAGPTVRIDSLFHGAIVDVGRHGGRYLDMMGVGFKAEEFEQKMNRKENELGFLALPGVLVLEKLGFTIRDVSVEKLPILKDEPFYCEALQREFPVGITHGTRTCVRIETKEGVPCNTEIQHRVFAPNEIEELRWRIQGWPSMEIRVIREDSDIATASSLFNRIPDVIAAAPGIIEVSKMGPEMSIANL